MYVNESLVGCANTEAFPKSLFFFKFALIMISTPGFVVLFIQNSLLLTGE